ncbi:hypothetical protein ACFX1X_013058 [Malus domestica]
MAETRVHRLTYLVIIQSILRLYPTNGHLFALSGDYSVLVWGLEKIINLQPLMDQMVLSDGYSASVGGNNGEILLVEHGRLLYPNWEGISVLFYVYNLNVAAD